VKIYLASLKSWPKDGYVEIMKLYLAQTMSDNRLRKHPVKMRLADNNGYRKNWLKNDIENDMEFFRRVYSLESFFYAKEWQYDAVPYYKGFMLDSGAYTFMENSAESPDWKEYVQRYIKVIKKYKIKLFYELDIDVVTGLEKVEEYRDTIEQATGRQSIPVWHVSRGMDYFHRMVEDYKYIAIGGIVSREIRPIDYPALKKLIQISHKNGCKIHGLGFTKQNIKEYRFDSVDSTAWVHGNIGGYMYHFTGTGMKKSKPPEGMMLKAYEVAKHNFMQWLLYAEYLEKF